ncbi:MarR family transcriptional regulator [Aquimarina sp. MMG015]|uniref:MarR family winged helix-turn-helix transcriptional regulator n=1 Tax=Aquimarina TaxID=290174 RepID=UPI00040ED4C6|nr:MULTISPECIES: MarR family transcriptional regulator [Aquimarina]AXT57769.1 transcriptional regulator [Aquimarina sp. AD1]MBQ4803295.1 MarR family transcriptional regulator [Aquimarina sp. MMG015]RKN12396.1 transcriptional regulator [Aquimarina sp. AD1]
MKDSLQEFGELGLGSRLNRLSEYLMKETQIIYNRLQIDFDPYLFPIFKIIVDQKNTTTSEIQEQLQYTQPAITQAIKKLLTKGLIKSEVDKTDKRKKLFQLSPKGKKTHVQLIPVWDAIDKQVKWLTEGSSISLTRHLTYMENQFKEKSLSKRILENIK